MSSNLSSKIVSESGSKSVGWDVTIRDTEEAILKTKERLAGLRGALRVFKERRDSGEPFPGSKPKSKSRKAKQSEAKNDLAQK